MDKPYIEAAEISRRLRALDFPEVDGVVAVLRGGLVPAFLIAHQLGGLPVRLIGLNLRDDANQPLHDTPRLTAAPDLGIWPAGARLLLVDDVCVSGRTLAAARELLDGYALTTCVLKGSADLVAFPEVSGCVRWPWHA
jgi:hypoxanthine phosphoribosyltransferase